MEDEQMGNYYGEDENKEKHSFWYHLLMLLVTAALLALIIFVILAISERTVNEGVVTDKKFTAAYDEYRVEEYLTDNGYFDVTRQYRITRHYPDVWQITVYGNDWLGRKQTSSYYVSEDRYNSLEIGDSWEWDGHFDYTEPPQYWEDPIFPDMNGSSGSGGHITVIPHY